MRGILGVTIAGLGALACAACADPIALRSPARFEAPRPAPSGLSERILRATPPARQADPRIVGRGSLGGDAMDVPAVLSPPPPMIESAPAIPAAPMAVEPAVAPQSPPVSAGRPLNLLPPDLPRPAAEEPSRVPQYEPAPPLPAMGRSEAERLASARAPRTPLPAALPAARPSAPSSRGLALPVPVAP